jgi:hypothetical protein
MKSPRMVRRQLSDDGSKSPRTPQQMIADGLKQAEEHIKHVENSTFDKAKQLRTYHLNEKPLMELLKQFYNPKGGVMPFANNPLQLAMFLCSLHGEHSYRGFELALTTCKLSDFYELLSSVITISAHVGETFDPYGFPRTFNRDNTLNAVFKLLVNQKFEEFDALVQKHSDRFISIAQKFYKENSMNAQDGIISKVPSGKVQEELFAEFTKLINEVIARPDLIPDPIRFVMVNFSQVADNVAPALPEDQRVAYFSIFLFTRFLIPRLTDIADGNSPRENHMRSFLAKYVASQLQALATNPDKALPWMVVANDAVRNMVKTLCMSDPTMTQNIHLRQRYTEIMNQMQSLSPLSPRPFHKKESGLNITEIRMPTMAEVDALILKVSKSRKSTATQLLEDCEKLKTDVRSNLLESILHWTQYYCSRHLSPHAQKPENKAIADKLCEYITGIRMLQPHDDRSFALFLAIRSSSFGIPFCKELMAFLEQRLAYPMEELRKAIEDSTLQTQPNFTKIICQELKSEAEAAMARANEQNLPDPQDALLIY